MMTPFREFFGRCFDFKGRTSRGAFWATVIVMGIINLGAIIAVQMKTSPDPQTPSTATSVLMLLSVVPWLALQWRRLHDVNRTGWWFLIQYTGVGAIVLLVWSLRRGTPHFNRFGPDPLWRGPGLGPLPRAEVNMERIRSEEALAELKTLGELKDKGVLTEDEFATRKAAVLDSF